MRLSSFHRLIGPARVILTDLQTPELNRKLPCGTVRSADDIGGVETLGRSGRKTLRAFSLLELIIIMLIVSTMAAIALPRYAGAIERRRADSAAWRIALDLSAARRQARIQGKRKKLTFYPATHEYYTETSGQMIQLSMDPYRATLGSTMFGGDGEIVFDAFGMPDSGGSLVVRSGSAERTVIIAADSGTVSTQ